MLFNSYIFIFLFLPLTIYLYFTLAKYSHRAALFSLFCASFIFYSWQDFRFGIILIISILTNYYIGKYINNSRTQLTRKYYLWIGILFNLGLLSYFKYTNFFIENYNHISHSHLTLLDITLPIGISFFTFTQIAFLVDTYRALVGQYQFLNYALFVTYFPHLIAGPIIHHKEVMPQFELQRNFHINYRNISIGLTIFSIGLFKKTFLADSLVKFVDPVFDMHLQDYSFIEAWSGALAYTLELYFDFSGYSDMAVGLSLLFGIKLPINFYSPYKSNNIIEFWRRWNMTLSRFLRDYLYIPLGGNRHGTMRRYLNLMITMILGGLWHGASWTFVMWGCLHGIYLSINHAWIALKNTIGISTTNGYLSSVISRLITFLAVIIAWVFFRSSDFTTAYQILHAMFLGPITLPDSWPLPEFSKIILQKLSISFTSDISANMHLKGITLIICTLMITWILPNPYQFLSNYKPGLLPNEIANRGKILSWKPTFLWNLYTAMLFVLGVMFIELSNTFLYFRF